MATAASFWTFPIRAVLVACVLFVIPFPYYWWSLSTGSIPPEAEWWAQGTNHGPWRWVFPGMALVLLPLYALFFGGPAVVAVALFKSIRATQWWPLLVSVPVAAIFLALAYAQASVLFWTID